jgi:hypothetical protein
LLKHKWRKKKLKAEPSSRKNVVFFIPVYSTCNINCDIYNKSL